MELSSLRSSSRRYYYKKEEGSRIKYSKITGTTNDGEYLARTAVYDKTHNRYIAYDSHLNTDEN